MLRRIPKFLTALLSAFCVLIFAASANARAKIPDVFFVSRGEAVAVPSELPVTAERSGGYYRVSRDNQDSGYLSELKLFGVIPIGSVTVQEMTDTQVILGGDLFGIKLFCDGVMVVGIMSVETAEGVRNPAAEAGIRKGDMIMSVDNRPVSGNNQLASLVENSDGKPLQMTVKREDQSFSVSFSPVLSKNEGVYKAGLWVRDSSAGIGTMTFISPADGVFAGLGHAVCDVDTGEILPVLTGEAVGAQLSGIIRSAAGVPGEVQGYFMEGKSYGTLLSNQACGIYGSAAAASMQNGQLITVAMKQQVVPGKAQILCSVEGEKQLYDCVIERVDYTENEGLQNMVVRITDPHLLEITGGIVQGMSGSPILQNGMLAGALTHVFLNQPDCGYGVFAETMLITAQNAAVQNQKAS